MPSTQEATRGTSRATMQLSSAKIGRLAALPHEPHPLKIFARAWLLDKLKIELLQFPDGHDCLFCGPRAIRINPNARVRSHAADCRQILHVIGRANLNLQYRVGRGSVGLLSHPFGRVDADSEGCQRRGGRVCAQHRPHGQTIVLAPQIVDSHIDGCLGRGIEPRHGV